MLNERIKELRLLNKLNQVQLSELIGVTKQTVSNWENNNIQPSIDMLIKLSEVFNVSTDYLLGKEKIRKLDTDRLSKDELNHIQLIINDIRNNH